MTTMNVGPARDIKTPYHACLTINQQHLSGIDVFLDYADYNFSITLPNGITAASYFAVSGNKIHLYGNPGPNGERINLQAVYNGGAWPLGLPSYVEAGGDHRPFTGLGGHGIVVSKGDDFIVENIHTSGFKNAAGNGAGIHTIGKRNIFRNCESDHNENGIFASDQGLVDSFNFIDACNPHHNGCLNKSSPNYGHSHNIYVNPAAMNFVLNTTTTEAVGQGLELKMHSGGGIQVAFNNIIRDVDNGDCSYQADFTNGELFFSGNGLFKGLNAPSTSKMMQYNTVRDATPPTGNHVHIFGNSFECYLQVRGNAVRVLDTDSTQDPGTAPEIVAGVIRSNAIAYRKTPTNRDYGYSPIVAPNGVSIMDTVKIPDGPAPAPPKVVVTWESLNDVLAAIRKADGG